MISGPWPAVRFHLIGRPCLSISAWILVVRPPRGRPKQRSRPPFCYRTLLVNVNDRAVDHLDIALMGLINRVHPAIPDHYLSPSGVAVIDRCRRTVELGEIRLGNTSAQPPEDAVEHKPIIDARLAARLVGKKRKDHTPFEIAQFVTSHLKTPFWEFESRPADFGNPPRRIYEFTT